MHHESVHDRIEELQTAVTPRQALVAVAVGAALAYALLFLQEPLAHDAAHTFRHGTGITCH